MSCEPGGNELTLAQAMTAAKASISLAVLCVVAVKPRMFFNGGMMLEVSGEGREV